MMDVITLLVESKIDVITVSGCFAFTTVNNIYVLRVR